MMDERKPHFTVIHPGHINACEIAMADANEAVWMRQIKSLTAGDLGLAGHDANQVERFKAHLMLQTHELCDARKTWQLQFLEELEQSIQKILEKGRKQCLRADVITAQLCEEHFIEPLNKLLSSYANELSAYDTGIDQEMITALTKTLQQVFSDVNTITLHEKSEQVYAYLAVHRLQTFLKKSIELKESVIDPRVIGLLKKPAFYEQFKNKCTGYAENPWEFYMGDIQYQQACGKAFDALKSKNTAAQPYANQLMREMLWQQQIHPKLKTPLMKAFLYCFVPVMQKLFGNNWTVRSFTDALPKLNAIPLTLQQMLGNAYCFLIKRYDDYVDSQKTISLEDEQSIFTSMVAAEDYQAQFSLFDTGHYAPENLKNNGCDRHDAVRQFETQVWQAKSIEQLTALVTFAERYINRHRNPRWDRWLGIHNTKVWRHCLGLARRRGLQLVANSHKEQGMGVEKLEAHKSSKLFSFHRSNFVLTGAVGRTDAQKVLDRFIRQARI